MAHAHTRTVLPSSWGSVTRKRMLEVVATVILGSFIAALVVNIIDAISQMLGRV